MMLKINRLILLLPLILLSACQATVAQHQQQQQVYDNAKQWYLRGDLLTAEQQLNQLHASGLASLDSWRLMGNIHFRQHRLQAAEQAYREALTLAANDPLSWHNLSLVKLRQTTDTLMQARSQLQELSDEDQGLLRKLLQLQRVQLQ